MTPEIISVPWGKNELAFTLPGGWRLNGFLPPMGISPLSDLDAEIAGALASPIGASPLGELAAAAQKVLIVVDDLSRPTPTRLILPSVLKTLSESGVSDDRISLLTALGAHRSMTEDEMATKVGGEVLSRLAWHNHVFDDPSCLAFLGTTRQGTPVYVNNLALEASLIISIGCIEPHVIASFGGGYKSLIPGIAGEQTVVANYALNCRAATYNMVGQSPERNPMRQDLEEAGAMIGKPVFIVNVVLNPELQPVRVVAGDPIAAHRAGCEASSRLYGVKVPGRSDVVIANSYPLETDLRQGLKALANTIRATKDGGVMLCLIRAKEGIGDMNLPSLNIPLGKGGMKIVANLLLPFFQRLKLKGMRDDDTFFVYFALQTLKKYNVVFYTPSIPEELGRRIRFLDFNSDLGIALEKAAMSARRNASVLVFPHAGVTYPIFPQH